MAITKVIKNESSQALSIPSEMHTERKNFIIRQIGEMYIAYPVDDPWLPLKSTMETFPEDYMIDREQPSWGQVAERA